MKRHTLLCSKQFFIFALASLFFVPSGFAKDFDIEGDAQQRTHQLLERLDNLPSLKTRNLNAIYSDQSFENVNNYGKRFCEVNRLINDLETNMKEFRGLIKQNKSDKTYRVYIGTLQLALYSIYSRPNEFLTFLNYTGMNCAKTTKSSSSLFDDSDASFEDLKMDWEIKAPSYLNQAKSSISKALKLDPFYPDARILNAQILTMEKKYDLALKEFDNLVAEEHFIDTESYVDSWRAYIAIRENGYESGETDLRKASAHSEPLQNAEWAANYIKTKQAVSKRHKAVAFTFPTATPPTINLSQLIQNTKKQQQKLTSNFVLPLAGLPTNTPSSESLSELLRPEHHSIFLDLNSDHSPNNIAKFKNYIEQLSENGEDAMKIIDQWNTIIAASSAGTAGDAANYYRMFRAKISLTLLEVIKGTSSIVNNVHFQQNAKENYANIWQKWSSEINNTLASDIRQITTGQTQMKTAEFLLFKYNMVIAKKTKSTHTAQGIIAKYRIKDIQLNNQNIGSEEYISLWNAYTAIDKKNVSGARKQIQKVGSIDWKNNVKKVISMHDYYKQHAKSSN